ncbi:hypothetical protein GGI05_007219, partial [Coemansia sp. RSA 2603]
MLQSDNTSTDIIKDVLKALVLDSDEFDSTLAAKGMSAIMRGEATDAQIGGFLTALKLSGGGWSPDV